MERIAILAGGGTLPLVLAESVAEHGGKAHIVGVRGEAGPSIEAFAHTWVTWGAVNRIVGTLKRESDGTMVIAGHVKRPDLLKLNPDFGLFRHLPSVLAMLRGGDDAVLTRVVRFFEGQGLVVKGVADVAPHLLAEAGCLYAPSSQQRPDQVASDIALGFRVLDLLADFDVGQAIAVENGVVLAIEGVEGTDRMLERIALLAARTPADGVLVKGPKRGQDLRVDMPAVGAQTIDGLASARLGHLVVVAGKTLLLERARMLERAEVQGIAVEATLRDANAIEVVSPDTAIATSATLLGRIRPSRRDTEDAATAARIVRRLAPLKTGHCAMVVRDHVLAIAASEPAQEMAVRVGTLRQWGRGRSSKRLGAAAIAWSSVAQDTAALVALIKALAEAKVAGLIVTATELAPARSAQLPVPAEAVLAADAAGIFLLGMSASAEQSATDSASVGRAA